MPNVKVGCLLPNGLQITLGTKEAGNEKQVILRGANTAMRKDFILKGDFGISEIDDALFEQWWKNHQEFDPVKKGLIFYHQKAESVMAQARERKDIPAIDGVARNDPKSGVKEFDPKHPDAD